jgi:hypothetical protein
MRHPPFVFTEHRAASGRRELGGVFQDFAKSGVMEKKCGTDLGEAFEAKSNCIWKAPSPHGGAANQSTRVCSQEVSNLFTDSGLPIQEFAHLASANPGGFERE